MTSATTTTEQNTMEKYLANFPLKEVETRESGLTLHWGAGVELDDFDREALKQAFAPYDYKEGIATIVKRGMREDKTNAEIRAGKVGEGWSESNIRKYLSALRRGEQMRENGETAKESAKPLSLNQLGAKETAKTPLSTRQVLWDLAPGDEKVYVSEGQNEYIVYLQKGIVKRFNEGAYERMDGNPFPWIPLQYKALCAVEKSIIPAITGSIVIASAYLTLYILAIPVSDQVAEAYYYTVSQVGYLLNIGLFGGVVVVFLALMLTEFKNGIKSATHEE